MAATDFYDDLASAAQWAVTDEIAAGTAEAQRWIVHRVEQATKRLNHREGRLLSWFFDYYAQWFWSEYGDRKNAGEGIGPWGIRRVREMTQVEGWTGWKPKKQR